MTVEDRLRATTEAVTESMRPVRPLDLQPHETDTQAPARPRRIRLPGRLRAQLVPLAAAMAVIAVAATLVTVRGLTGTDSGSRPTPAATSTSTAPLPSGVPRYYVALTDTGTSKGGAPMRNAFLGDASTGKVLATFKPPSDAVFDYAAASADDRTFVLEASEGPHLGPSGSERSGAGPTTNIWYVLRLPLSAAGQARLTRVPIASPPSTESVAVSPDGRSLAVLSQATSAVARTVKPSGLTTLRTYSLATGHVLRAWTAPVSDSSLYAFEDLTWLDDGHTLSFVYPNMAAQRYVRTLDITNPGTNLIADSRTVFSVPTGHTCDYFLLMTADGKSVICGVMAVNSGWCTTGQLAFTAYSVATGKLERVLYRYQGGCHFGTALVVWAKSATLAIGWFDVSKPVTPYLPVANTVGVVTPGKFTRLPVALRAGTEEAPGNVAF